MQIMLFFKLRTILKLIHLPSLYFVRTCSQTRPRGDPKMYNAEKMVLTLKIFRYMTYIFYILTQENRFILAGRGLLKKSSFFYALP